MYIVIYCYACNLPKKKNFKISLWFCKCFPNLYAIFLCCVSDGAYRRIIYKRTVAWHVLTIAQASGESPRGQRRVSVAGRAMQLATIRIYPAVARTDRSMPLRASRNTDAHSDDLLAVRGNLALSSRAAILLLARIAVWKERKNIASPRFKYSIAEYIPWNMLHIECNLECGRSPRERFRQPYVTKTRDWWQDLICAKAEYLGPRIRAHSR